MKTFQRIINIIVISMVSITLIAQTEYHYKDKFILKNFIMVYGQLIEIKGDTIFLELEKGKTSYLMMKDIRDVKQYGIGKISDSEYSSIYKRNLLDQDKKNFFQMSSAFSIDPGSLSTEVKYLRRYHLHHFLTAAYGLEVVEYHSSTILHPITIGHQSILYPTGHTPFFNANIGYTFAHLTEQLNGFNTNVKGGLRLNAGVGMLFRAGNNTLFKTGLELVHQHSVETLETQSFRRSMQYRSNRILFSIGLMF